jgi:hypothetical protein
MLLAFSPLRALSCCKINFGVYKDLLVAKNKPIKQELRFLRVSDDGRVINEISHDEQEPLNWNWILTHLNRVEDILYQLESEGWHARCHSWTKPITISVSRPQQ